MESERKFKASQKLPPIQKEVIQQKQNENQKNETEVVQSNKDLGSFINFSNLTLSQINLNCMKSLLKFRLIYALIMIAFGIHSFACSIIAVKGQDGFSLDLGNLQQNMQRDPILTMRKIDSKETCLSTEENLFYYNWPGLNEGCDCQFGRSDLLISIDKNATVYSGACSIQMMAVGCRNLNQINEKLLENFNEVQNQNFTTNTNQIGFKICVKRLKNYNFVKESPKNQQDLNCASRKICGNPEKIESIFCVPEDELCPINQVILSRNNPDPLLYNFAESIKINSTHYLWISRNSQNQPISEFSMQEGAGICRDPIQTSITQGRQDYILLNYEKERQTCGEQDLRFTQIIGIGEKSFFYVNGLELLLQQHTFYNFSDDFQYNLFARNYIYWDLDYREYLSFIFGVQNNLSSLKAYQIVVLVANCIFMIALSLFYGVMELCNIFEKKIPFLDGDTSDKNKRIVKMKIWFNSVPKVFQLPFNIALFTGTQYIQTRLKILADNNISDTYTNEIINQQQKVFFKDVYIWVLQIFVMMTFALFLDFIQGGGYFTYLKFPNFFKKLFYKITHFNKKDKNKKAQKNTNNKIQNQQDQESGEDKESIYQSVDLEEAEEKSKENDLNNYQISQQINIQPKQKKQKLKAIKEEDIFVQNDQTVDRNVTNMALINQDAYDEVVQM